MFNMDEIIVTKEIWDLVYPKINKEGLPKPIITKTSNMENTTEMLLSEKRENKKFTQSWKLGDYEILTDDGYVDVEYLHETEPYEVYELKLENGYTLKCADDHIVFRVINWNNNSPFEGMISGYKKEIFVKDLTCQDFLLTDDGVVQVLSVTNLGYFEKMYDFQLAKGSNKRY